MAECIDDSFIDKLAPLSTSCLPIIIVYKINCSLIFLCSLEYLQKQEKRGWPFSNPPSHESANKFGERERAKPCHLGMRVKSAEYDLLHPEYF